MISTVLKEIKFPDDYVANIATCIEDINRKVIGLKIHDYHVLLYLFLIIVLSEALLDLGIVFWDISSKTLRHSQLYELQAKIVITLCKFGMIFSPPFFTIMIHLSVYLVYKAHLGVPLRFC